MVNKQINLNIGSIVYLERFHCYWLCTNIIQSRYITLPDNLMYDVDLIGHLGTTCPPDNCNYDVANFKVEKYMSVYDAESGIPKIPIYFDLSTKGEFFISCKYDKSANRYSQDFDFSVDSLDEKELSSMLCTFKDIDYYNEYANPNYPYNKYGLVYKYDDDSNNSGAYFIVLKCDKSSSYYKGLLAFTDSKYTAISKCSNTIIDNNAPVGSIPWDDYVNLRRYLEHSITTLLPSDFYNSIDKSWKEGVEMI